MTPLRVLLNDTNSQPKRTATFGISSATDFSSGSSVYCEMS